MISTGGGGSVIPPPIAQFVASPLSGYAPLSVQFTDASTNFPSSWTWSFQGATTTTSLDRDPIATWTTPGKYDVSLTVQNAGGSDTHTELQYVEVLAPPTTGPIPAFSADPTAGKKDLTVAFTDETVGATTWAWDLNGDGVTDSTAQNPTYTYTISGAYDVTLDVSDGTTTNSLTKRAFILVDSIPCRVPNFFNVKKNDAQALWTDAGFTTALQYLSGPGNYKIKTQSLAGTSVPTDGCAATIEVGP